MKRTIAFFVLGVCIVWSIFPYLKDLPKWAFPVAWGALFVIIATVKWVMDGSTGKGG